MQEIEPFLCLEMSLLTLVVQIFRGERGDKRRE